MCLTLKILFLKVKILDYYTLIKQAKLLVESTTMTL